VYLFYYTCNSRYFGISANITIHERSRHRIFRIRNDIGITIQDEIENIEKTTLKKPKKKETSERSIYIVVRVNIYYTYILEKIGARTGREGKY
jgi:hypothetical protein